MSALSSPNETSSRTWWSLASKSSASSDGKELRRPYSVEKASRQMPTKPSLLSFNSFASAIRFKSKKHPSLAIQQPPPSIQTVVPPATNVKYQATYSSRPPSKSVSSILSPVDSLEPRTPLDGHQDADRTNTRQSLLTLADLDPFAGRGAISSHSLSDPNRLSGYSNSSALEYISKNPEVPTLNLESYASNNHGDLSPSPLSILSTTESTLSRKITAKQSTGSLRRKQLPVVDDGSLGSAWENLTHVNMSKSGSSSTITEKNRLSQPDPTPVSRPLMRARGMTDSVTPHQGGFLPKENTPSKPTTWRKQSLTSRHPLVPHTSPRVIIRQPSTSRIGLPPSAPPRHELPPPPASPPLSDVPDDISELAAVVSGDSASSSSLSFASSVSSNQDIFMSQPYSPRQKEKKLADCGSFSPNKTEIDNDRGKWQTFPNRYHDSTSPRTLKKVLSQQSLGKRSQSHSPIHTPPPERVVENIPRKQRSFHHPKIPIPPIPLPLRHPNAVGSPSTTPPKDTAPIVEQNRGSASGTSSMGRKRLFSVSSHRRPSTSPGIAPEDDTLSIFSLRSDLEQAGTAPFKTSSPTTSSFLDEPGHDHMPNSLTYVTHEYVPQQIMSPAEMAKVEASVEESSIHVRKRGLSLLSAATTSDGEDEYMPIGLSPRPLSWKSGNLDIIPSRSISLLTKGLTAPRLSNRPSTSQANMTPSNPSSEILFQPSSSPPHVMASLPPPPRPRHRSALISSSPPDTVASQPPPPVRKNSRAKASVEKQLHWRSIMRKPSFLEIDDETEKDVDVETNRKPLNSSFLDLARESFDTVRSINE